MSTRAVYTFVDEHARHHVYKHCDGYPAGAVQFIEASLALAWPLPRFEADEFASAFIAANKKCAGDIRLTHGPETHGDLTYRYEIGVANGQLEVIAFRTDPDTVIFCGTLEEFKAFTAKE